VDLQALGSGRRRLVPPEFVDQPVGRHDAVGVQEQQRQQRAPLRARDPNDALAVAYLQLTE
jgi:hypothetical protein